MRRFPVSVALLMVTLAMSGAWAHDRSQHEVRLFALTTAHGIADDKPSRPTRIDGPYRIELWIGDESIAQTHFCVIKTQTAGIPAVQSNLPVSEMDPLCTGK